MGRLGGAGNEQVGQVLDTEVSQVFNLLSVNEFLLRQAAMPSGQVDKLRHILIIVVIKSLSCKSKQLVNSSTC